MQENSATQVNPDAFVSVSLKAFRNNTSTNFDLYVPSSDEKKPVLAHKATTPLTRETLDAILKTAGYTVLIRETARDGYKQYLEEHLGAIVRDAAVSARERAGFLYDVAQRAMKALFSQEDPGVMHQRADGIVDAMIFFLTAVQDGFNHLLSASSANYYFYTHSANVFIFSLALAIETGYREDELREIALGALLHDIGKRYVDPAILNFPGKLNKTQFIEIKRHPLLGYEALSKHPSFGAISLDIVRHHHEKLDASGYPDGLAADSIAPWVRIAAIADVFDALTTDRVYKNAVSSYPALKTMFDEMSKQLDSKLFASFVEMMGGRKKPVAIPEA